MQNSDLINGDLPITIVTAHRMVLLIAMVICANGDLTNALFDDMLHMINHNLITT